MKLKNLLAVSFVLLSYWASAQDRMFAFTYQSNVLSKGGFDLEFQNELLTGKSGKYSPFAFGQNLNQRLEFEFGLGHNIQTSFYLNSELFNYADTSMDELAQELKISFSNEWKWKLSDPVANTIGFALYEELEIGGNNFESETKLIFDKRMGKDLVAFNAVAVYEIEREVTHENGKLEMEWEQSYPLEFDAAYMHFFTPQFGLGVEFVNSNDMNKEDGWMNSVLYGGLSMHAQSGRFFANLSTLPQLSNLHKTEFAPGAYDLDGGQKLSTRLIVGYSF
jgi:hypothetical protein